MPRKKSFAIKMVGREYRTSLDVPTVYTQSMMKFESRPFGLIIRTVNRDHPYMRLDQGKPLLHLGRKNRG